MTLKAGFSRRTSDVVFGQLCRRWLSRRMPASPVKQTNFSSAQYSWVCAIFNTRMFHHEPHHEIMVQLYRVYIYKLWDVCTLLNTWEKTFSSESRGASRFMAGLSLCPVLTLLALYGIYREDRPSRNPGNSVLQGGRTWQIPWFSALVLSFYLLWLLHSSGRTYTF